MSEFVITAPATPSVAVAGSEARFPVRRVFCVGRNYASHAREMGSDPNREPPFFFTKPADAIVTGGKDIPYPPQTSDFHHEIELVVAIGTGGADIAPAEAEGHILGYAAGLDMTRRDLQTLAKKAGRPWDMAKGFDLSAPIGEIAPVSAIGHPAGGAITLEVNGVVRQRGDLSDMTWDVSHIVADLSRYVTLAPGDIIMTGTPAGVGAVVRGDLLEGRIEGVGTVTARIA